MGKRAPFPSRVNQRYAHGDGNHGAKKRAMAGLSGVARQRLQDVFADKGGQIAVADTSHLLVTEHVPLRSGEVLHLTFYDPVRMVQHVIDHSCALRRAYGEKLMDRPSPWRIVLGFDEQTPGSKVNQNNQRKICA